MAWLITSAALLVLVVGTLVVLAATAPGRRR